MSTQRTDAAHPAKHCGDPDERSPERMRFIGTVADRLVSDLAPDTTLDVGCGLGLLVEALVDRGVDAWGIDTSEHAISQVRQDIAGRCRIGSALEPLGRRYDLITCIDVGEHLPAGAADTLVANICAHTDEVMFVPAPGDHRDDANVNVDANPPERWAELFARHGLLHDLDYDPSFIAPQAMRFRRGRDPLARVVGEYERELWRARDQAARLADDLETQQRLLLETYEALRKQEEDLRDWRDSGAGRLAYLIQRGTTRLAPPGTMRQRGLHRAVGRAVRVAADGRRRVRALAARGRHGDGDGTGLQAQYDAWRSLHEPGQEALDRMRQDNRLWPSRPLVSVIMPTYNSRTEWLRPAIDSVLAQAYESWELCVADDGSSDPEVVRTLQEYAETDARIRFVVRDENGGIAAASGSALELAGGEFIALLDHDDVLRPHALHRMVECLQAHPDSDVIYSDEDLLFFDGTRGGPHFKPDWSPDLLLSVNYVCHLLMARRELVEAVGGFRPGFDGAQDHDLLLRLTERARRVSHVADVLYSWRQVPGSVAGSPTAKMYAYEAGGRAVESALARRGLRGSVSAGRQHGTYHARRHVAGQPQVAIVIPTRDRVQLLRECVSSIETLSTYPNWTITIIDNGSVEAETHDYLATTRHAVVHQPGPFNYSRLMNLGRSRVDAPYVLMLNNDIATTTPGWIEAMLEHAQREEVGVVGCRLVYPDGRTQHEGIGLGNICAASTAVNLDAGWLGRVVRDVSAVTGACQMVRTTVYDEVGGYDESLHVAYNDVDFCLRVRATGRAVVYTPHAELCHRESASRGGLDPLADRELFWRRWGRVGGMRDPYINPHLRSLHPMVLRLGPLPTDR